MADSKDSNASQTDETSLLCCKFNQDGSCLAIGTSHGFSIHNLHPPLSVAVDRALNGGVGHVSMLLRTNILCLVGGGPQPLAAPHRVLLWDDHAGREMGELAFRQAVLGVELRHDSIAVALRDRVYVYVLQDLTLRDKIYTADNPHGLLAVSSEINDMRLACPSVTEGHVRVELYRKRQTVLIPAHESALRALALTCEGKQLATASFKGTVIRLFDVGTSSLLREFRRGVERANVSGLAFAPDHRHLACTSDKGTAHVFDCTESTDVKKKDESLSSLLYQSVRQSVQGDTHKSVCQVRGVPHPLACCFVNPELLAITGWDADGNGVLLLADVSAAEPQRMAYHVLVKSGVRQETEEAQRRRRLRGWRPRIPETPEGGRLYVGERLEILERGMEQIHFDEDNTDDFVAVNTATPAPGTPNDPDEQESKGPGTTPEPEAADVPSPSAMSGDSVKTEPLDGSDADPPTPSASS